MTDTNTVVEQPKMTLLQKLNEISKTVMYIEKTGVGFKGFKYATSTDILSLIRPKMHELGVILRFKMESCEMLPRPNGTTYPFVNVSYTWINMDDKNDTETTSFFLSEDKMTGAQCFGALLTYAERYFLFKYFNVPTDEDSPEVYYKKHKQSAFTKDQEKSEEVVGEDEAEEEDSERVTFCRTPKECEGIAKELWGMCKSVDSSFPKHFLDLLPGYLSYAQSKIPTKDIRVKFEVWSQKPAEFMEYVFAWKEREDGQNQQTA